jgi:hypothetical protein
MPDRTISINRAPVLPRWAAKGELDLGLIERLAKKRFDSKTRHGSRGAT